MTGAELSQHMCDVAAETIVMNNCAHKCIMVCRLCLLQLAGVHAAQVMRPSLCKQLQPAACAVFCMDVDMSLASQLTEALTWMSSQIMQPSLSCRAVHAIMTGTGSVAICFPASIVADAHRHTCKCISMCIRHRTVPLKLTTFDV